jgi:hypothetical protein
VGAASAAISAISLRLSVDVLRLVGRAAGWVYDAEMFAGDRDRERAAVTLREHYVRGRLTLDEFSSRIGTVLTARSKEELGHALWGLPVSLFAVLPVGLDPYELASRGRHVARAALRGALLVFLTGVYVLFSFSLLLVLGLTLLVHGASIAVLIGFLVVWLIPTWLLSRLWLRGRP